MSAASHPKEPQGNVSDSLTNEFLTRNLTNNDSLDGSISDLMSSEMLDKNSSIVEKFIRRCLQLSQEGAGLSIKNTQSLQLSFAYCIESINGDNEADTEKKRMFFCFNVLARCPGLITSIDDLTFITDKLSQRSRAWVSVCLIQALRNRTSTDTALRHPAIDHKPLMFKLQTSIAGLHACVTEISHRKKKSPELLRIFKQQLTRFDQLLAELDTLLQQLSINKDTALQLALASLNENIKAYLLAIEQSATYANVAVLSADEFDAIKRELAKHQKEGWHNAALDVAYVSSEFANIGLVLQEVVGGLSRSDTLIALGISVGRYTNPMIYGFKALQRGIKVIGRKYFGLEFAEDEVGVNPKQNRWDIISACLFLVVTGLLVAGAFLGLPGLIAGAWLLAPVGLGLVWKSEYGYQNERAKARVDNMSASDGLFDGLTLAKAKKIARHKKVASMALAGVIFFIALGMLAGSLASIPGLGVLFQFLTVKTITTIAGGGLALLAVIRASNFVAERGGKKSLQALGQFLKSLPANIASWLAFHYEKFCEMSSLQKVTLLFSLAAVGLSLAVVSGGMAPLLGLLIAGGCQFIASLSKGLEWLRHRGQSELPPGAGPSALQTDVACERAINMAGDSVELSNVSPAFSLLGGKQPQSLSVDTQPAEMQQRRNDSQSATVDEAAITSVAMSV